MDFTFNKNKKYIPYWTLSISSSKTKNPVFLDEINFTNFSQTELNNYSWIKFLRSTLDIKQTNNSKLNLLTNFNTPISSNNSQNYKNNYSADNLININFLRYERLYTKLKYSRSPAFDIVSGGAAAILAGFVGFLISEKFGFELVDSGDFYYLFMYIVFASFMLKPFMYIINVNESILQTLSIKNILMFYTKILTLFFVKIKLLFK